MIADTHLPRGSRRLPDSCVRRLEAADLILHAGDFTAVSVLEEVERYAPIAAVYGNMDEPALRERLPVERVVEVGGVRSALTHDGGPATGRAERLAARFPECGAVVYGHSHSPEATLHGAVLDPQPREPDRASAGAGAHDDPAAGDARAIEPEVVTL